MIFRLICKFIGHKYDASCDWGFSPAEYKFDIWCKRCDKMETLSIDQIKNINSDLYLRARKQINTVMGIDVNQKATNETP